MDTATTPPAAVPLAAREAWRAALTLANNLCVQESDRANDNDETREANATSECARRIRDYLDLGDGALAELLREAGAHAALRQAAELTNCAILQSENIATVQRIAAQLATDGSEGDAADLLDALAGFLSSGTARDAALWRGLAGSARVRVLGSAGLYTARNPYGQPWDGYAHIGLELWTRHDAGSAPRAVADLTRYAEIAAGLVPVPVPTVAVIERADGSQYTRPAGEPGGILDLAPGERLLRTEGELTGDGSGTALPPIADKSVADCAARFAQAPNFAGEPLGAVIGIDTGADGVHLTWRRLRRAGRDARALPFAGDRWRLADGTTLRVRIPEYLGAGEGELTLERVTVQVDGATLRPYAAGFQAMLVGAERLP